MLGGLVKILLVEDNLAEARLLQEVLKGSVAQRFFLAHVKRLREALERLAEEAFDAILLDLTLPDSQGLDSLQPLMDAAPSVPIVVLTNTNDEELALEAVRRGAQDYLLKRQVSTEVLVRSLRYAIERKQVLEAMRETNQALQHSVCERTAELVRAKEVNQLKSEFVSMLSHDFRNPLTAILLSAGLLQEHDRNLSKEKKLSLFEQIRVASKNMTQLLDEVLLIGRADVGKLPFQPTLMDLEAFCTQMVEEMQPGLMDSRRLLFFSQGNLQEAVCDASLLRHIFSNLLSNAIKYSPAGSAVQFEAIAKEEEVVFRVRDWGIGIPAEDLENLFQPFHRAGNVGTIPGTGLGLAIVKLCVDAHGGRIAVESGADVGTIFTVTLPLIRESQLK